MMSDDLWVGPDDPGQTQMKLVTEGGVE